MINNRQKILNHITQNLNVDNGAQDNGTQDAEQRRLAVADYLKNPTARKLPANAQLKTLDERITYFKDQALQVSSYLYDLHNLQDLPQLAYDIIKQHHDDPQHYALKITQHPLLTPLKWHDICDNVTFATGAGQYDDDVIISVADAGVSETGTLVFFNDDKDAKSLLYVAQHHLVILPTSCLYANYDIVLRQFRQDGMTFPNYVDFISGASRSADIEQTLTLGAHGPLTLNIILYHDKF